MDDISKMLIPEDWMLSRRFFDLLEERWGPHTVDFFASGANNLCAKLYALHWCRGPAGINVFGQLWTGENCWINCPYSMIGKAWRSLREQRGLATMLIPLWDSAPWWQLVCPDTNHFSEFVLDWVALPRGDPSLFVAGTAPGRSVPSPDWPTMAVRVDFREARLSSAPLLNKSERCIRGGCSDCGSRSWRRQQ